jgi:hypothetical protein
MNQICNSSTKKKEKWKKGFDYDKDRKSGIKISNNNRIQ